MQMCSECSKIYDESKYAQCPFCSNDEKDVYVIIFDEETGKAKSVPKKD